MIPREPVQFCLRLPFSGASQIASAVALRLANVGMYLPCFAVEPLPGEEADGFPVIVHVMVHAGADLDLVAVARSIDANIEGEKEPVTIVDDGIGWDKLAPAVAAVVLLAKMPPCSRSAWGTQARFVLHGEIRVVRLCEPGVALFTMSEDHAGRVLGLIWGRFTAWPAVTGVGVGAMGRKGESELVISTPAETLRAAVASSDDPALPKLLASILAAKGWT